jgi:hypothetical protein
MKKQNKYRNIPTIIDGIKFASKKEAQRYKDLILMQKAGIVKSIELQKPYDLNDYAETKREQVKYICDFFVKWKDGRETVEDTKGYRTQTYKLKKKFFETRYRIKITEI